MTLEREGGEALDIISRVLGRLNPDGRSMLLTLENGIVLRVKPLPPLYIEAIEAEFAAREPQPPQVPIEGKDRSEPNYADPDYRKRVEAWDHEHRNAVFDMWMALATELVSVPEGVFHVDDDAWIEEVRRRERFARVPIPINLDDADMRYLSWLRFYALDNNTDIALPGQLASAMAGLREEEIAAAVLAFRRVPRRGADPDVPAPSPSNNGHRDTADARRPRPRSGRT